MRQQLASAHSLRVLFLSLFTRASPGPYGSLSPRPLQLFSSFLSNVEKSPLFISYYSLPLFTGASSTPVLPTIATRLLYWDYFVAEIANKKYFFPFYSSLCIQVSNLNVTVLDKRLQIHSHWLLLHIQHQVSRMIAFTVISSSPSYVSREGEDEEEKIIPPGDC